MTTDIVNARSSRAARAPCTRRWPALARYRELAQSQPENAHRIFSDLGADPYVQACAKELAALQVIAAPDGPAGERSPSL